MQASTQPANRQNMPNVAVKALLMHGTQALLLRRSNKNRIAPGIWELPGGKLEFGEMLEDALAREVAEETGLAIIGPPQLLYAQSVMISPTRHAVVLCYLCRTTSDAVRLSFEHDAHLWATREELVSCINPDILRDFKAHGVLALPVWGE